MVFETLTINIAVELFGLFFCLVCICISVLSPDRTGRHAAASDDIQNLFVCDAFVMFSDSMAGIFRGKEGTAATLITHGGNFALYFCNYMLFGLMINLVTHMIPSGYEKRFRRVAWGFVAFEFVVLIWNVFSGKIYFIDEHNLYLRAEWFPLSQIVGIACVLIGMLYIIQFRKNARRRVLLIFMVFALLCATALIFQMFAYGIAWLNIAVLMGLVIIFVYNQMFIAESLAEKQRIIAEQALSLEQSRTQLIVSQIKPHFLFNTLTSIAQLCDDDPKSAKETTINFAKYLRKNMQTIEQTVPIPFEDELSHIKCYLDIEKVRFGDRLQIEYDVQMTDFKVPSLTVQPLIENAVKHGVVQKPEGGTVRLSTAETDDAYVIRVTDDGVGFDPDAPRSEKSYGIRNIETRLTQLCNAALTIKSKPGEGTEATVTIPKTES